MHAFTSVTSNYIPKARVLAHSIKKFHPEAKFHLVLCDAVPAWLGQTEEPFDSIITVEELPIPDCKGWIFKHMLVEMCTGVKGTAFKEIINRYKCDKVFYFDPDMAIFSRLDSLLEKLDNHGILLTPHLTVPEQAYQAIIDNEISVLKHGVFNLGFLGIKAAGEGLRFLDWWAERLLNFCYDDIPGGLFTDQRWVDMVPAFFDEVCVLREPNYNVATWNLTHRIATGSLEDGIYINGKPLCFYHFSGFDSGAQEIMLNKYGSNSPVLKKLREWYIDECSRMGQDEHGSTPCVYGRFSINVPISKEHRLVYRTRPDIQKMFNDPFVADDAGPSYFKWYATYKKYETAKRIRAYVASIVNEYLFKKTRLNLLERNLRKIIIKPLKNILSDKSNS